MMLMRSIGQGIGGPALEDAHDNAVIFCHRFLLFLIRPMRVEIRVRVIIVRIGICCGGIHSSRGGGWVSCSTAGEKRDFRFHVRSSVVGLFGAYCTLFGLGGGESWSLDDS